MKKYFFYFGFMILVLMLFFGCVATTEALNNPPDTPSYPSPANNDTVGSLQPTLEWSCSDPDGDSLTYKVYFGKSSNPPLKKSYHTSKTYSPGTLDPDTTYYWRIVASDGIETVEGPIWSFKTPTINHPPTTPSNPIPSNYDTISHLSTFLEWSCSDPDGDSLTFKVYFGTSSNPPLVDSYHTNESYYTGTLLPDETYYWKIVAKDGEGGTTSGPIWRFETPETIKSWNNIVLHEDYWLYSSPIYIGEDGRVFGNIYLKDWDEDYGLEVLFMTTSNYENFEEGNSYSAWHKSFYTEGTHSFAFGNVSPGWYRIVVDNSNKGWDDTDWDGVDDVAIFDLKAYFGPY